MLLGMHISINISQQSLLTYNDISLQKVKKGLQVLNKNWILLIKMDTVHNSEIDHFEFVKKANKKIQKRLFFEKF